MRNNRAFTLIEIMVVVVIIAALAAMVVPRLSGRSDQARVAIAKADISSSLATALKLYDLDNGQFPSTEQGLNALLGPYIENKPVDPWGRPYRYKYPGEHNRLSYDLYSLGKDGADGTEDDVKNWE